MKRKVPKASTRLQKDTRSIYKDKDKEVKKCCNADMRKFVEQHTKAIGSRNSLQQRGHQESLQYN